ncbi:MAG: hypothetical protein RLZ37_27, partial [Actinomycetota bacterium]
GVINHYIAARQELEGPGSPFAVTTVNVRGVDVKTFAAAPPDMRVVWEMTAAHGDKPYLIYEDERFTYAEVHAQVRKLAHYLVSQGVTRGDRVAVSTRNYPEWVVAYWATVSLGAALVGMNAWWTPVEMDFALNDSTPKILIVDDERLERFQQTPTTFDMHVISVRTDRDLPPGGRRWADHGGRRSGFAAPGDDRPR